MYVCTLVDPADVHIYTHTHMMYTYAHTCTYLSAHTTIRTTVDLGLGRISLSTVSNSLSCPIIEDTATPILYLPSYAVGTIYAVFRCRNTFSFLR